MADDSKKKSAEHFTTPDSDRDAVVDHVVGLGRTDPAGLSNEEREYAAARWLVDLDDKPLSPQQLSALAVWLRASDENCREFLRMLQSFRRTLILRRSVLPILYGPGQGDDDLGVAKLRGIRRAEVIAALSEAETGNGTDQRGSETIGSKGPRRH